MARVPFPANAMGYQNGLSKPGPLLLGGLHSGFGTVCQPCRLSGKGHAIVEKIRERYHNLKYYIYPMLGTMSTQSGPDSIGIFYTKNK